LDAYDEVALGFEWNEACEIRVLRSQQDLSIRVLFPPSTEEHLSHGHGITSCRRPWSWRKRGDVGVVGVAVGEPCLPPILEDTIQVEGHVIVSAKIQLKSAI